MTAAPTPVYTLCACARCAHQYAVLVEPLTQCQLWYDRRYCPRNPEARVSGEGLHCPWCGAALTGTPGVLVGDGEWVSVGIVDVGVLN